MVKGKGHVEMKAISRGTKVKVPSGEERGFSEVDTSIAVADKEAEPRKINTPVFYGPNANLPPSWEDKDWGAVRWGITELPFWH